MTDINADVSIETQPTEQVPTSLLGNILPSLPPPPIMVGEQTPIFKQIETVDEEIKNLKHMREETDAKLRCLVERLDELKTEKKKTTFITQLDFDNAIDQLRKEKYPESSYNVGKLNATYISE
jgi:hypothetical protein